MPEHAHHAPGCSSSEHHHDGDCCGHCPMEQLLEANK
jgi:hypothetical protein